MKAPKELDALMKERNDLTEALKESHDVCAYYLRLQAADYRKEVTRLTERVAELELVCDAIDELTPRLAKITKQRDDLLEALNGALNILERYPEWVDDLVLAHIQETIKNVEGADTPGASNSDAKADHK